MNYLLVFLLFAFAAVPCTLSILLLSARKKLAYFRQIGDAESYQASCQAAAASAVQQCQNLRPNLIH